MKSTRLLSFNPVELLVVLLSAATLAALLFPVFSQARVKASNGICLTNMKQILVAASMYSIDYDGQLPAIPGSEKSGKGKVVPMNAVGIYR